MEHGDAWPLVDVPSIADSVCYRPYALSTDAVLHPHALHLTEGKSLGAPDFVSHFEAGLPPTLCELLLRFQSRLVIAGGAGHARLRRGQRH